MIEELKYSEFKKAKTVFANSNQHLPVFSIINGSHPGRIFVDDKHNPKSAIAWAIGRWAYIDGDFNNRHFNNSLPDLIKKTIIPDSKKKLQRDWFELYVCGRPEWKKNIDKALKEFESSQHRESVYIWNKKKYSTFRSNHEFPNNILIRENKFSVISEKAQQSSLVSKKFKTKTTFGFSVIANKEEVAHCRSTGFEVGKTFMINVITHDANYRKKGYATIASVALLDYCLNNDLVPLWETTEDNIGSQRLAKKLGFVKENSYPVYTIEF